MSLVGLVYVCSLFLIYPSILMWHMNIRQLNDRVVLCRFGLRCRLAECPRTPALYTADPISFPFPTISRGKDEQK